MQCTQADSNKRRVSVQEDIIKFRPSPNFKNMKKFLKNRNCIEEQNVVLWQPIPVQQPKPTPIPEQKPSPIQQPKPPLKPEQKPTPIQQLQPPSKPELKPSPTQQPLPKPEQKAEVKPVVVQPPLPPYPPPPDSPLNLNITIKQEKQDEDEVLQNSEQPSPSLTQAEQEVVSDRPQRVKKTMCKEFIRGDCKRSVCRYSHELDLAQLRGVFTFCWNYQNTKCTYPYCKFVHATVFEEAEFYRTGILPPHARSHMKKPLPPPSSNDGAASTNYVANQTPQMHPGVEKPLEVINSVPTCSMEQRPLPDYPPTSARCTSSPKREWGELDEFSSSPRDLESTEPLAKKCKNCEFLDFRLQYNKEKIDSMVQARDEMAKKTALLNKKSNKLSLVMLSLMKPGNIPKGGSASGIAAGDRDKSMLEQLGHFINTSNRLSSVPSDRDESMKNAYGGNNNISTLMAKIFCGNSEQPLTVDTSRET